MRAIRPFCLLALCLPLLMGAEVYRWVDENGVVNYTQVKPRGVAAEPINTRGAGASAASQAARAADLSPAEAERQLLQQQLEQQARLREQLEQAEQQRRQDMAQIRQDNCDMARSTLEQLTVRSRVSETNDRGERRVLPEEERQQRIKQAQDAIVENCVS